MEFGKISKDALPKEITTRLLDMIREKALRPGDQLPPERELAAMMGVSRPSVREALRALALMNVLDIRQGSGTYVSSLDTSLLIEHLDFVFSLDDSTFLELFEARKILEAGIVALAAKKVTDKEINTLQEIVTRSTEDINDLEAFLLNDRELHEAITHVADNPILTRFMVSLSKLGLASRSRTVRIPGVAEQTIEDHQSIVAALRDRDPEQAKTAMLEHLSNVERRLRKSLEENSETG